MIVNMDKNTRERKSNRLCLQSTKKIGCPAHIIVKEYNLYPDFALTEMERDSMKLHEIRQLKNRQANITKALIYLSLRLSYDILYHFQPMMLIMVCMQQGLLEEWLREYIL